MTSTRNRQSRAKTPLKKAKKGTFRRLMKLTVPQLPKIFLAALCVVLINVALITKPYILKLVIDDFFVRHVRQRGLYTIVNMGLLYFAVAFAGSSLSYIQQNIINRVGQNIIRGLRSRVFRTIQFLPLHYLDKTSSGRLITRATNDVEALSQLYSDVILSLFQDVFLLIGILYAMFALNVQLALLSLLVLPIMSSILFFLRKRIKQNFLSVKRLIGRINGFMAENISGMRLVQMFRAEKRKGREFSKLNDEYSRSTLLQVHLNSILKPGTELFQSLTIALLLWYGIDRIAGHTLEIGVLYAFTTYVKQFFSPIADLADNYTNIQSAMVSAERIFDLIDQQDILEDIHTGKNIDRMQGSIEFRHVWFAYDGHKWVLRDVSFKVNKGQIAAFVGETGAGKTTIISLINGFYSPQKGTILIDGMDIRDISLKSLRRNIAVVLQDVFLFSGNVYDNVALNDRIGRETVKKALEVSCADDFVGRLPGGLDEPVMEGGNTFSAGQKQLIAFARAIAHEPAVLVCDEATANIDTQTEKLIQQAIENVSKNRTTLMIAHRLSTIRNADLIIVMKNGKIIERGNHRKLMEMGGYYSTLFKQNAAAIAG